MTDLDPKTLAPFFAVFFIAMWFAVTTMLSLMSGWFSLMRDFPDRDETAILKIGMQSGSMGVGVSMGNILRFEVCPHGLRLGIVRLFGPFCRDLFIPWTELAVTRRRFFVWNFAVLRFEGRGFPKLTISERLADRLARGAQSAWPEDRIPPPETRAKILTDIVIQWLAVTAFAAGFFTIAPRMMAGREAGPPLAVAIGFPAVVFGIVALARVFVRLTD